LNAEPPPSIARRLLDLALPIIGLNVLAVLTLAVDTAMCGRLPDAALALTALGYATQFTFLLMVAMMGVTVGTVVFVSRAHGAGDGERVNHILAQSTMLTVIVGLSVGGLGITFATPLLAALGASDEVTAVALPYVVPLMGATVFNYLNILYAAVLRGVGNTRLPFLIALVANAINVVINYGLILGNLGLPALGVQGAAIGTICSWAFAVTTMIWLLRRGTIPGLFVSLRPRRLDTALVRDLFRVGAPAALDMVILNASFLSIIGMLGRIDQVAVAAHGVGLRIQALAFVPGMSISQATGALVGQALGAGDTARARAVLRASMGLCITSMSLLAIIIVTLAPSIVQIFDVSPASPLGLLSVEWIRLLGYGMPIVGAYIAFVGLLQGSGSTRTSLRINALTTLLFQIPLSAVLGFWLGMGAFGVWLAFPLAFVLKAIFGALAYRDGRWARVGVRA